MNAHEHWLLVLWEESTYTVHSAGLSHRNFLSLKGHMDWFLNVHIGFSEEFVVGCGRSIRTPYWLSGVCWVNKERKWGSSWHVGLAFCEVVEWLDWLGMCVCVWLVWLEWLIACRGFQFASVADDIRDLASKDPAHRKLFVRGLAWETSSQALRDVSACLIACMLPCLILWSSSVMLLTRARLELSLTLSSEDHGSNTY
jgi:hypothetical protein